MKELFISSSLENHVLVSFGDPYYFMFFHGAKNADYFLWIDSFYSRTLTVTAELEKWPMLMK